MMARQRRHNANRRQGMYEKLQELGTRLESEGRQQDASLVFSAMLKFLPRQDPLSEEMIIVEGVAVCSTSYS